MEQEIWKDVVGHEGLYQVSNLGRVKRLAKKQLFNRKRGAYTTYLKEKVLRLAKTKKGYLTAYIVDKHRPVHRLVCQSFYHNPENKPEVNHKDCNKKNNKWDNLEWCTQSENMIHAFRNGLNVARKGEENNKAKLTEIE